MPVDWLACAAMARRLPGTGDAQPRVDVRVRSPGERGGVAGVEDGGDPVGDRPREDWQSGVDGGGQRRAGSLPMVGVSGHTALVEDEQVTRLPPTDPFGHVHGKVGDRSLIEAAVGVVEQLDLPGAQSHRRRTQLTGADSR